MRACTFHSSSDFKDLLVSSVRYLPTLCANTDEEHRASCSIVGALQLTTWTSGAVKYSHGCVWLMFRTGGFRPSGDHSSPDPHSLLFPRWQRPARRLRHLQSIEVHGIDARFSHAKLQVGEPGAGSDPSAIPSQRSAMLPWAPRGPDGIARWPGTNLTQLMASAGLDLHGAGSGEVEVVLSLCIDQANGVPSGWVDKVVSLSLGSTGQPHRAWPPPGAAPLGPYLVVSLQPGSAKFWCPIEPTPEPSRSVGRGGSEEEPSSPTRTGSERGSSLPVSTNPSRRPSAAAAEPQQQATTALPGAAGGHRSVPVSPAKKPPAGPGAAATAAAARSTPGTPARHNRSRSLTQALSELVFGPAASRDTSPTPSENGEVPRDSTSTGPQPPPSAGGLRPVLGPLPSRTVEIHIRRVLRLGPDCGCPCPGSDC